MSKRTHGFDPLVWLDQRLDEADVVIAGNTAVLTGVVIDEVERDGTAEVFERDG